MLEDIAAAGVRTVGTLAALKISTDAMKMASHSTKSSKGSKKSNPFSLKL